MSISGLSNHLCCVAAIVINLLAGSSLFRPAIATANYYDFPDSRQFKRNLAVSKYRDNTYWLPNYKWTPPERSNGPRKKPLWEVNEVTESGTETEERKEFEEWEKKMREVTKREREKWKTESETSMSSNKLHNGRWGMSTTNQSTEEFIEDSRKSLDSNTIKPTHEEAEVPVTFPNGRWGMSVKEVPKDFLSQISANPISQRPKSRVKNKLGVKTLLSSEATTKDRSANEQPDIIERSDESMDYEKKEPGPETPPTGHQSMEDAPNKENMSRRYHQTLKIHNGAQDEDEAGNMKFDSVEKGRRKMTHTKKEGALTKLSMELPSNRWGSNGSSPFWKFLREISRRGNLRVGEFRGNGIWQKLFPSIMPKNVHRSWDLPFIITPKVSYNLFLQFYPRISQKPS